MRIADWFFDMLGKATAVAMWEIVKGCVWARRNVRIVVGLAMR